MRKKSFKHGTVFRNSGFRMARKKNNVRLVSYLLIAIGLVVAILGAGSAFIPELSTFTVKAFNSEISATDVPAYSALFAAVGLAILVVGVMLLLKSR
jgi:hypothetical protein